MSIFSHIYTLVNQIWLSVSSINFYKEVYKNYVGYGIKYLFTISFIASICYSLFILNYMVNINNYLKGAPVSALTENIEYILNQLPEIKYKGTNISIEEDEPIYLYNKKQHKIGVIDVYNKISPNIKSKIPIVLTNSKLIINLSGVAIDKKLTTELEYYKIFAPMQEVLTPELIKKSISVEFSKFINIFTYIGVPILVLLWFITFLFEKSFIIALVYVLTNAFGLKIAIKKCIRLVFFASGLPVLLQPFVTLQFSTLNEIILLTQIYTAILLFTALWQIKNHGH